VRRFAAPTILLTLVALLAAAPAAAAELRLPAGADAAPKLPPGVVPAPVPPVSKANGQRRAAGASMSVAKKTFRIVEGPPPLWATVNICDTKGSPNAFGVRASVPGNGSRRRVYARFTAQWWSGAKQAWLTVGGRGTTDWVYIGTQGWNASQGGWTFHFSQPPAGTAYVIRGVVELSWRQHARASRRGKRKRAHWSQVDRRVLLTQTGKTGVRGGDPVGTSKAMCLIW
jgi:hypothetical protein